MLKYYTVYYYININSLQFIDKAEHIEAKDIIEAANIAVKTTDNLESIKDIYKIEEEN